ncbi:hypothetical protein C8Q77DRAFT_1114729 [Trametes polyzona]|nr:hypothetical protein C8Q77DRAFT_1114729 [Trametes polyzona]
MGIFGVNLPTIYGEGRNAFYRLQEEILRHAPDQSIFAWGPLVYERYGWPCEQFHEPPRPETTSEDTSNEYLFAPSPKAFEHSASIAPLSLDAFEREIVTRVPVPEYTITSYGIRTQFPIATLWSPTSETPTDADAASPQTVHVAVLACVDGADGLIALLLRSPLDQKHHQYKVGCRYPGGFVRGASLRCLRALFTASSPIVDLPFTPRGTLLASPTMAPVYVPYRPSELVVESYATRHGRRLQPESGQPPRRSFVCPCEVVIPPWTLANLYRARYIVAGPQDIGTVVQVPEKGALACIVLVHAGNESIQIGLGPCPQEHSSFLPQPLTVVVSFNTPPVQPEVVARQDRSIFRPRPMPESCKATHAELWEDGVATFVSEAGVKVKLTIGVWTTYLDSGNSRGLYSLTIDIERPSS